MLRRRAWLAAMTPVALVFAGCGSSLVKTEGVVKLDGQPVEGATVTFMSDDGKQVSVGVTDATGKFELHTGDKPGAAPGAYKVTVLKAPKVAGAETMTPGSEEYLKSMKEEAKDEINASKKSNMYASKMPGMTGARGSSSIKSELPAIYGGSGTTPLTAKVPSDGPIVLELQSKPGKP